MGAFPKGASGGDDPSQGLAQRFPARRPAVLDAKVEDAEVVAEQPPPALPEPLVHSGANWCTFPPDTS